MPKIKMSELSQKNNHSEEELEKSASENSTKIAVLVVEDDKFLRELLARKLKASGFDVMSAIDGKEVAKKIEEKTPQLILLDLVLPGVDGFEILKELKGDPKTKQIPVIVLSNLGQKEEVEKGIKLGASDYLIKAHFTPDEIINKIRTVLGEE